jgi:hypothetical protein
MEESTDGPLPRWVEIALVLCAVASIVATVVVVLVAVGLA